MLSECHTLERSHVVHWTENELELREELALEFERPQRHCYLLAWRFDADLSASARRRSRSQQNVEMTWLWLVSSRKEEIKM